jgi:hypothetical protein
MNLTDPVYGGIVVDVDRDGVVRRLRSVHSPLVHANGTVSDENAFRQLNENAIEGTKDQDIDRIVFVPSAEQNTAAKLASRTSRPMESTCSPSRSCSDRLLPSSAGIGSTPILPARY